ncbi:MAG: crosslink repair DNA glycosylase YcaQ family protein [Thermoplasmata archaeon]
MAPETRSTVRKFILGRQGLWPGRRWQGRKGLDQCLRYIGSVQFDSLNVVGRSHDLALWGRILDYKPEYLEDALYRKRTLFETGGNVQIRPIGELPYLRIAMQRKIQEERWRRFGRSKAGLLTRVTREIERRGPLGPGDFEGPEEKRIEHYRAAKESGLALHYLWLKGDIMIAFRRRGEKVFDLTDRLFPRPPPTIPIPEAEDHLILQTLRHLGVASSSEWLRHAWPRIGRLSLRDEWKDRIRLLREKGIFQEIEVAGWKGRQCIMTDALSDLRTIHSSRLPSNWRPRSTTTTEEVVFLAPLEDATARGRAKQLFDFEYIWEVYKPAAKRRWGYYTLPILWGERLCARIEMRADRATKSLQVTGFWPEDSTIRQDAEFATALGRALGRLADFNGVVVVDTSGLRAPTMRRRIAAAIKRTRERAFPAQAS